MHKWIKRLGTTFLISIIALNLLLIAIIIKFFPHPAELIPKDQMTGPVSTIQNRAALPNTKLKPEELKLEVKPSPISNKNLTKFHDQLLNPDRIQIQVCDNLGKSNKSENVDIIDHIYQSIDSSTPLNAEQHSFMILVKYLFSNTSLRRLFASIWEPMNHDHVKPTEFNQAIDKLGFYYSIAQFVGEIGIRSSELNQVAERSRVLTILSRAAAENPNILADGDAYRLCKQLEDLANRRSFVVDGDDYTEELQKILRRHEVTADTLKSWNLHQSFKIDLGLQGPQVQWGWLAPYRIDE